MLERESAVYSEIILHMTEERFQGICVLRDIRAVYELEHVRNGTFQMDVCLPDLVVCI